jgi:hypothetical protein
MTKKEMDNLADEITKRIFDKLEADAKLMQQDPEEWVDLLVSDEDQMKELELLIHYYETNEDYIKAANTFKVLTKLKKNI